MKELKVIITRGLQCSGKTTWAEEFIKVNQNYKRVNRDSLRHMLSAYTHDEENERLVTTFEQDAVISLIETGKYNIVIDAMHLNEKYIEAWKQNITHWMTGYYDEVTFTIKEFPVHLAIALERDAKRAFPIGAGVIKNTWRRYELELKAMLKKALVVYPVDPALETVVLSDLDGTLFHSYDRKIFDFKACVNDTVIEQVEDMLDMYKDSGVKIILFSAREDICREETIESLKKNFIAYDELFMRKAGDKRNDVIVKREMFDEHIRGKYNVKCVIDDRISVCQMWVDLGLFVFCVNQDPFAKNQF